MEAGFTWVVEDLWPQVYCTGDFDMTFEQYGDFPPNLLVAFLHQSSLPMLIKTYQRKIKIGNRIYKGYHGISFQLSLLKVFNYRTIFDYQACRDILRLMEITIINNKSNLYKW